MKKKIAEQNLLFILAILAFIIGIALIWVYFTPARSGASSPDGIVLKDNADSYTVNEAMEILPDINGDWSLEDIQSPVLAAQFQPAAGKSAFGLSARTYWVRMKITNQSVQEQWVLRLSNSVVDHFDIYLGEQAGIGGQVQVEGLIKDHYWSYALNLSANQSVNLYVRAKTDGSMILPIEIMNKQEYSVRLRNEYILFGMYYGFVLLMAAYMLAMYIFMRLPAYVYYSLYILCFAISQLVWNGLLQEILGKDHWLLTWLLKTFNNFEGVYLFFFILCLWFATSFLSRMLQLGIYSPRMRITFWVLTALAPLTLIALLFHLPGFSTIAILYESIVVIVLSIAICWTVYKGNRAARFLVLGIITLIGLAYPAVLYTYSLMDYSVLTHYGYQIGSIGEFILLAFALSYQSRQNQVDKVKAQEQMIANQEQLVLTLEHWNEELEQTVKERTDKLVQSQKKRNELLQNISHDIRSPLTVVQGGIRAMMLGIQIEPGEKDKFTEKIYDKVLFITRFIDDLFMLSRFDESMAYDAVEEVQAKAWINREFEILAEDIRITGHICEYRLMGKDGRMITIDQHGIRRVLSNLIHNACKFSPPGSKVELEAVLGANEVRFSVTDYGDGISLDHLSQVFTRGYRGDQSEANPGSGLGLAIAQEIIERHNGEMTVESELGKGSCFYFTLPVVRKEE